MSNPSQLLVCIRDKSDVGVVSEVSFAGRRFKVTKPHGVLDPQPTPAEADAMTKTKTFAYVGYEHDRTRPTEVVPRTGPPTFDDITKSLEHRAQVLGSDIQATGPLARVTRNANASASMAADEALKAAETSVRQLQHLGRAPTMSELDNTNPTAPPAPTLAGMYQPGADDGSVDLLAAALENAHAVAEVAAEEGDTKAPAVDDGEGADDDGAEDEEPATDYTSMSLAELRVAAKSSGYKNYASATQGQLLKFLQR